MPPSASSEFPAVLFGGAGKGTFLVAEQDRLDKRFGEGAAIDGNEWLGAARAAAMNGACDQLFADAGFTFHQNRNCGRRGFFRGLEHGLHCG